LLILARMVAGHRDVREDAGHGAALPLERLPRRYPGLLPHKGLRRELFSETIVSRKHTSVFRKQTSVPNKHKSVSRKHTSVFTKQTNVREDAGHGAALPLERLPRRYRGTSLIEREGGRGGERKRRHTRPPLE